MRHPLRRRAGVTLVEIVISTALLAGLVVLALGTVSFATRPAAETAIRSHLVTQGGQAIARMVAELEGGRFFPAPFVGSLNPASGVFTPEADGDGVDTAIRGQKIVGWDVAGNDFVLETNGAGAQVPYVWAFVPASGGTLRLVRSQHGLVVPVLSDIQAGTASFRFVAPSTLAVAFTVRREIGWDQRTNARAFTQVRFDQTVNLRDKNQR